MPNRLQFEQSPYLLQHRENPVDWRPWGSEAFQTAREEDKPVFLSIGYSTCHWCHVMAHESFADETVAEAINRDFIPIKVDREERPDVDAVYMAACVAMTGSGGWPLTVLLTPEQEPFWAGTYLPRQALLSLLQQAARLWREDRGSLLTAGEALTDRLREAEGAGTGFPDRALAGMAAGMATGLLHTGLGIPGILASILTQVSLYSVNLGIMGKSNQGISLTQQGLVASSRYVTGDDRVFFFLKLIVGCLILVAIVYWFFGTEMGASIRATGCNPQMARAQGINTNYTKVLALTISNGLVGLCGGILAQYQGAADVNMGRGAIVIGLAAVIISEVIFGKLCAGKKIAFAYTLAAVFVGAILYYVAYALVLWLKMPSDYMKLFSALVVAVFLAVPYLKGRWAVRRRA